MVGDLRSERSAEIPYPPGETGFSLARAQRFVEDPLALLLGSYERFGPVFTLRLFHLNIVFMLGPQANHYITVANASNFSLRDGLYRDFIDLVGDGLLTSDGAYHRRARSIMLPAFHRERIAASAEIMLQETERAVEQFRPGASVEFEGWLHELVLRIALRTVLGLDRESERARGIDAVTPFEQALAYYSSELYLRLLRGPGTPWRQRKLACRKLDLLIYGEISRRRATGNSGEDVLGVLIDARDRDGDPLTDRQIRDEAVGVLVAGRDTTSTALLFAIYELARDPAIAARLVAEQGALAGGEPTTAQLMGGELPQLEMVVEETLRKYPPSWVGPRRSLESFEFDGKAVPGGALVSYSAWATQHLPEVFPDPYEFLPERFAPDAKAALPKGAYMPFGGGSRSCIGMRFAQLMIRVIITEVLRRFTVELPAGYRLEVELKPSLRPKHGLPVIVRPRMPGTPVPVDDRPRATAD
jgi:cytochrome P450